MLALLLALLMATPAVAQRAGLYDITGRNPDGSEYSGTFLLEPVGISTFRITWEVGGNTIQGAGMISGRMLAVVFGLGQQTGMGMYELRPDGVLDGTWTILGSQAIGQEVARPR